ncbi:MAG TPA: immunoglobulin domain-containing protein [Opitutaceae bacterium]
MNAFRIMHSMKCSKLVRPLRRICAVSVLWTQFALLSGVLSAAVIPASIEVGDGQVVRPILVQEAGPWTVVDDVPWLSVPVSEGYGDRNVEVTVERNTTGADRTGSITLGGATFTVIQRAAGSGLRELWAMGDDSFGQLGYNPILYRTSPVQVMDDVRIVDASIAGNVSMFVKNDGTLWAMGWNASGGLGDGTTTDRSTPVQVASDVASVAAEGGYSLFVKTDGTLWEMGSNTYGQLGDGSTDARVTPLKVATDVVGAAVGCGHILFVKTDGTLWALGFNLYGQLGNGTRVNRNTPVQVASDVAAVAAGWEHSLFVKTDGTLWGMGSNVSGQLGDGTREDRWTPVQVASGVVTMAAERGRSLFVKTDGTLWGTNSASLSPVQMATDVASVAAGYGHSLFVKTDETLWAMGQNSSGQLGDGSTEYRSTPVQVASGVSMAAAGNEHSLFVKTDGTLWAMGASANGQLGDGSMAHRSSAVHVDSGVKAMATGNGHSLFLKTDGTLWAMGLNEYGQLGEGTTTHRSAPVQVASGVATVAAGGFHSLFVKTDGTLWAMGANGNGQLGDGTTTDRSTPVQAASDVTTVAAGWAHSLFEKTDGTLWAMGDLSAGPNRYTSGRTRTTPLQVASDVSAVAAGLYNSLFVKTDGTLWGMGKSYTADDLSDFWGLELTTPVKLASDVSSVALGLGKLLFLKTDETLWTMGNGTIEQLASGVAGAATGSAYSLFVKTDGTLWAMGANYYGQLGDGTTTDRSTPVQVASGVTAVAAGYEHSLFIASGEIGIAPKFTSDPVIQSSVIDGTTTFTATVTGTGPLSYQWRRNGTDIAGATSASLTISNVQANQGGSYSVVVSNSAGRVMSNLAVLTIDPTPRLINVSARGFAGSDDSTLIMGFYISGTGEKTVLIRGIGPRLSFYDVPSVVADPMITLYRDDTIIDGNDDWNSSLVSVFETFGAFELIPGSADAATTITLSAGHGYTVHLVNDGPVAEGLIEVYDISRDLGSRLTNVSCRLNMNPNQLVILGTALIAGQTGGLVRNVGPGIAPYLPDPNSVLADPHLRVFSGPNEVAVNDDWELATRAYFVPTGAFDLPDGSKDAAARAMLTPGENTVHATGKGGGGIAIIEIYESP